MLSNRHHTLTLWQVLLALCLLTSCIGDKLEDELKASREPISGDSHYLSLKLKTPDGASLTRASFHDGDENEHKVGDSGHSIIFFNKKGELMETSQLLLLGHTHHETDDDKEATYSARVYPKDNEWPASCLVVLNGSKKVNDMLAAYEEKKKEEVVSYQDIISGMIWSAGQEDPKTIGFNFSEDGKEHYFTMTNSMYYDEKGDAQWPVKIPSNAIAESEEEAEEKAMTVYVERMVAKCTFKLDTPTEDTDKEDPTIIRPIGATPLVFFQGFDKEGKMGFVSVRDWRINITGWSINALETQNYLFKHINKESDYFDEWNNPTSYRFDWSEDCHYNNQSYPWQYRKAIDRDFDFNYYSYLYDEGHNNTNLLRNYSYYDLKFDNYEGEGAEHNSSNFEFNKTIYIPENTYDKTVVAGDWGKAHDSRDELLAGTHLLIGAELEVYDNKSGYRIYDLYRDRNGIYYESERECFASLVHSFNQSLTSQSVMEFVPYDWDYGGGRVSNKTIDDVTIPLAATDTLVANTGGSFMLCYKLGENNTYTVLDESQLVNIMGNKEDLEQDSINFANNFGSMVPATLRSGDGRRLPWFKDAIENGRLAIKKVTKNPDGTYTIDEDAELSIHIKTKNKYGATVAGEKKWNNADKNDIKSILYEWLGAVDHFNNGKMYYATGIDNTPTITLKSDKYYGVVRNSWYKFKLKEIKSIGIPIDDPTQPIVPDFISNNDQINVSVEILPWHEVEGDVPVFFW
ncbi:MAG: Mfa1 fimbrilin C-terminal domain-containing protein [Prevotella sp.]|nr:Mfa1 fimbrilin C-terminal domain-containing protein [Prevotella sp.]